MYLNPQISTNILYGLNVAKVQIYLHPPNTHTLHIYVYIYIFIHLSFISLWAWQFFRLLYMQTLVRVCCPFARRLDGYSFKCSPHRARQSLTRYHPIDTRDLRENGIPQRRWFIRRHSWADLHGYDLRGESGFWQSKNRFQCGWKW